MIHHFYNDLCLGRGIFFVINDLGKIFRFIVKLYNNLKNILKNTLVMHFPTLNVNVYNFKSIYFMFRNNDEMQSLRRNVVSMITTCCDYCPK